MSPRRRAALWRACVRVGAAALLAAAAPAALPAYETDQYSNRLEPIADSADELNRAFNEGLAEVAAEWRGPLDPARFAYRVYAKLGGLYWVDRIERYAMRSPTVEKLPQRRHHSIFSGAPIWATRVNWAFGIGDTIRVGDSLIGTDKLGHFVSQGYKYFRSHLEGWSEDRIAGRGRFNERWLFGQLTTSVYSNADLVANWEGYRFYRSLFEDGVVAGKPAILRVGARGVEIQRPFDWRDHVNDYWDEALNPSFLSPALATFFRRRLPILCADFEQRPGAFVPRLDREEQERYSTIGLRPALEFRMDHVCAASPMAASGTTGDALRHSHRPGGD